MPKFFCDYCDVYLTHDNYYQQIGHEKAQSVIDSITSSYAAEGQPNPMLNMQPPGGMSGMPMIPGFPPTGMPGMPPPFAMPPAGRGMPGFPPFGNGVPPNLPNLPSFPGFPPAGFPPAGFSAPQGGSVPQNQSQNPPQGLKVDQNHGAPLSYNSGPPPGMNDRR